jgi:hypothetical protein
VYAATRKIWPVILMALAVCVVWAGLHAAGVERRPATKASLLIPARAKLIIAYSRVALA